MIFVELECGNPRCPHGAGETIDVYLNDWQNGVELNRYLPEGWTVAAFPGAHGMPIVRCPDCEATKCKGFRWIGQSFATCDECGMPFWEHEFDERLRPGAGPFDDEPFQYAPITDEQRQAVRAKWGR